MFESFRDFLGIVFLMLLLPGKRTLDRLGRSHASGAYQLSREVGILLAQGIVGAFVQLNAVTTPARKALMGYGIVARRMLFKRPSQEYRLFLSRFQLDDHRSIHAESISYIPAFVILLGKSPDPSRPERKTFSSPG